MINPSLISIIIPCYNAESTLEKCLVSVLNQDYENFEVILINDGSTDGTAKIIEDFKSKDERISAYYQSNSGVSKARNFGISKSTGDYICFVDSDDWVETNYCSALLNLIIENRADISIVDVLYEDEAGNSTFSLECTSEVNIFNKQKALELLLEDKSIKSYPCAKLYKKELFSNISFPEHLEAFEDYYTLFKVFFSAKTVVKSNIPLYHYIQYSNSLSHNLTPIRAYHFFLALKEAFEFHLIQNLDDKANATITKNIVKKMLMVLKRILRNTYPQEMLVEKEDIRLFFARFFKYKMKTIGIENFLYVRLYHYYPKLYLNFISKKS